MEALEKKIDRLIDLMIKHDVNFRRAERRLTVVEKLLPKEQRPIYTEDMEFIESDLNKIKKL